MVVQTKEGLELWKKRFVNYLPASVDSVWDSTLSLPAGIRYGFLSGNRERKYNGPMTAMSAISETAPTRTGNTILGKILLR